MASEIKLIHGDCLEVMKTLPEVDAIITDLPYGTTACSWDVVIPFEPMWEQVKRIDKGVFVTTASQPFTSKLVMSNLDWFKYEWIWHKNRPTGAYLAHKRPLKLHENILVFYENQPQYNPIKEQRTQSSLNRLRYKHVVNRGIEKAACYNGKSSGYKYESADKKNRFPTSVQKIPMSHNESGVHPTQKPVALYQYLIKTYTNEGDTVLDITMGSGTTGVACVQTGRNFIGIEIDEAYCAIAEKRIAEAQLQMRLL